MTTTTTEDRKSWLGLLARSPAARLAELMPGTLPDHTILRSPEIGSVMLQARSGGAGALFHLGEMTVTRCSLRLTSGAVGHACVQGRDRDHATRAALIDALMQSDQAGAIRAAVLTPLATEETARRSVRAGKAAATKVDFFTLIRGEDA